MLISGILLALGVAAFVALAGRQILGSPVAIERWVLGILGMGLLFTGGGLLAANLVASVGSSQTPSEAPQEVVETPTVPLSPVSEGERQGLGWVHHNTVEIFVARPGFGMRRLRYPLEDVVSPQTASSSTSAKDTERNSSIYPRKETDPAHYGFEDMVGGMLHGFPLNEKEQLTLRKVQLVGLIKHRDPVVYNTDKVPGMKDVKDTPTRSLNSFETSALEALRTGESLKIEKRGHEVRMMGPIFAGKRCAACHEEQCQMLGAFSYELKLEPVKPKSAPIAP